MTEQQPRALFAVRVREKGRKATDLILDTLEDAKVDEESWDWAVWYRGNATYAVVSAPLPVRGVLAAGAGIEVLPMASVSGKMDDNRNEWVAPKANASLTALERAQKLIAEWSELQFIQGEEEIIPEVVLSKQTKTRTRIASRADVHARKRSPREVRAQQGAIATALGLDRETDSAGNGFTFSKLE